MTPKPHRPFSWPECLMLIAVLGILISILVPTGSRLHVNSRRSVDASNIRQIAQASLIYAFENQGRLPGLNLNQAGGTPVQA